MKYVTPGATIDFSFTADTGLAGTAGLRLVDFRGAGLLPNERRRGRCRRLRVGLGEVNHLHSAPAGHRVHRRDRLIREIVGHVTVGSEHRAAVVLHATRLSCPDKVVDGIE